MLSQGVSLSGLLSFSYLLAIVIALAIIGITAILPYRKTVQKTVVVTLSVCICAAAFIIASAWPPQTGSSEITDNNMEIVDGVQIVHSTLKSGSYPTITVQAGIPVKWIIDAPNGSINGCNNRMIIHEYNIEYSFQTGENIIEFTPDKTGSFSYSCWMGMIHGNIIVTK